MNYFILGFIFLGLLLSRFLGVFLEKSNWSESKRIFIWCAYIGIYFSFFSVYLPYSMDINYKSDAKLSPFKQWLLLTPLVFVIFFSISSILNKLKSNK